MYKYIDTYIYTYIHTYICTYTHTYIHTDILYIHTSLVTKRSFQLKHPEIMIAKVLETKKGSGKAYSSDFDDDASVKSNLTYFCASSNLTYTL